MLLLGLIRNTCSSSPYSTCRRFHQPSHHPAPHLLSQLPFTCIHHFAYMMYCWISKVMLLLGAAYGGLMLVLMTVISLSLSLSIFVSSSCVCECQCRKTKAKQASDRNSNSNQLQQLQQQQRNNDNKGDKQQMALLPGSQAHDSRHKARRPIIKTNANYSCTRAHN